MSKGIEEVVREKYAAVAASSLTNESSGVQAVAEAFGYSAEELASIPAEANMGLSCGNPTATANLRPGEVVVDLGSGGGIDVLLAAKKVGPDGQGHRHRHDRRDARPGAGRTPRRPGPRTPSSTWRPSTSCRSPTPRPTASSRTASSTSPPTSGPSSARWPACSKPGGRVAVSDIALKKPLPPEIGQDLLAYVGCIAGAIPIEEYREGLKEAGFAHVEIIDSGADLNAYAQIEGQVGCCGGEMASEPEPVAIGAVVVLHSRSGGESSALLHADQARGRRRALLHDRGEGGGERRGGLVLLSGRVEDARAPHAARGAHPPLRHQRLCGEREGLRREAPLKGTP